MMSVIEPRYKVVSRNHILEKYIVPRYQTTMLDVKSELSIAKRHAFTTDAWTSLSMDSFITTTCHYINPQTFQLQSRVLDTKSVQTRNSAENLAEEMRSVVEKWGLKDPVSVTDNAANVVNACRDAGYPHIGCFGHTLNLAVNKCMAVNEVNALLGKCRKLVSVFKQSYIKTIALHSAQAALKMRQLQVIQDVDTRWNSALAMISRLFDILPAVWATLYKDSKYSHFLPTDNDRRNIEDFRTLLSPMETATNKVSSEKNPTASFILPILERLLAHDLAPKETDSTFIKKAKESMRNDLLKRYKKDEEQTILNMATVVDPRFKDLQWMNSIGRVGVYDRLKTEMLQVEKIELVSVKAENLDNEPVPVKQEEKGKDTPDLPSLPEIEKESEIETGELSNSQNDKKSSPEKKKARKEQETSETKDDFFDVLFVKADKSEISKEAIIDAEIQRYKAELTVPMNQDPLEWWQNQRFLYPFLASVVLMYLQIPVTSVPSERVFSTAGNILNKKRGALSASNADMLIFLNHNIKRKQQQSK